MTNRDRRRIAAEGRPVAARSDHAQNVAPPFLIKAGSAAPRRRVDPAASARVGRAACRPYPTRRAARWVHRLKPVPVLDSISAPGVTADPLQLDDGASGDMDPSCATTCSL
jgi:hypothetical protein